MNCVLVGGIAVEKIMVDSFFGDGALLAIGRCAGRHATAPRRISKVESAILFLAMTIPNYSDRLIIQYICVGCLLFAAYIFLFNIKALFL
jgi:hypothetical protein